MSRSPFRPTVVPDPAILDNHRPLLRRMERRGLVTRHDCSTDGRGTMVRLTDEGMRTIVAAAPG